MRELKYCIFYFVFDEQLQSLLHLYPILSSLVSKSEKSLKPDVSGGEGAFAVCWAVREVLDWWCQRAARQIRFALLLCVCAQKSQNRTHTQREKPRAAKGMRWKIYFPTPPLTADAIFLLRQQIADGSLRWWIIELKIIDLRVWVALSWIQTHHSLTQREKCARFPLVISCPKSMA